MVDLCHAKRQIDHCAHLLALAPAFGAPAYPFLLDGFHELAGPPGYQPSLPAVVAGILFLLAAFTVPLLGFVLARRDELKPSLRRLAYASVASPTLYVFVGVIQAIARSPVPDEAVWCFIWSAAVVWIWFSAKEEYTAEDAPEMTRWRVAHGISALILCAFVLFHLGNHLTGLIGPKAHAAVMSVGRSVYREPLIEPFLVTFLLFQVVSGFRLAWRWSALPRLDIYRTFQIGSGFYLSVFVLGHMNSVFFYARRFLQIPTDWNFAIGAPDGLIHGAWSIRLLPHYALGVFFVLSHLASGLRVVLIAHGFNRQFADRFWIAALSSSAIFSGAIIAGMCGVRIDSLAALGQP